MKCKNSTVLLTIILVLSNSLLAACTSSKGIDQTSQSFSQSSCLKPNLNRTDTDQPSSRLVVNRCNVGTSTSIGTQYLSSQPSKVNNEQPVSFRLNHELNTDQSQVILKHYAHQDSNESKVMINFQGIQNELKIHYSSFKEKLSDFKKDLPTQQVLLSFISDYEKVMDDSSLTRQDRLKKLGKLSTKYGDDLIRLGGEARDLAKTLGKVEPLLKEL